MIVIKEPNRCLELRAGYSEKQEHNLAVGLTGKKNGDCQMQAQLTFLSAAPSGFCLKSDKTQNVKSTVCLTLLDAAELTDSSQGGQDKLVASLDRRFQE